MQETSSSFHISEAIAGQNCKALKNAVFSMVLDNIVLTGGGMWVRKGSAHIAELETVFQFSRVHAVCPGHQTFLSASVGVCKCWEVMG